MAVPVQVIERVNFQKDIFSLIKDLSDQRKTGELCDIIIKVNGRNYFAHKAVLGATSPYFRSMFTSCMKEQASKDIDLTSSLDLERPDSFKLMLDYIYTGEIEINVNNAEDMLRIADFLLFEDVKEYCKQFYLQHGNLNINNCFALSELAEQHNLVEVAHVAESMVQSRFHDYFVFCQDMNLLPESLLLHILSDKSLLRHAKDIDLMLFCFHWIRHDPYNRKNAINSLWDCICIPWLDRIKLSPVHVITELCHKTDQELTKVLLKMKDKNQSFPAVSHPQDDVKKEASELSETQLSQQNFSENASQPDRDICNVLLTANCNSALKYTQICLYDIENNCWRKIPSSEALISAIPTRLNVCSWVQHEHFIYMFISYNLPYPTDLLRIHIVVMDLAEGPLLTHHTLRHCYNTGECCKSTLTDDHSVPPALIFCNNRLCLIGNMEGTGQVFICDLVNNTYNCFQIPGTRFISLARAVVKYQQYIYIWCRHRYGHEEFCIHKHTTFVIFDIINKTFHDVASPPGISYGEFADAHALCVEGDDIVIYTPGKTAYFLDESRNEWQKRVEDLPSFTEAKMPIEVRYHGYELYTSCDGKLYMLHNPAAYTTQLLRLSHENGCWHCDELKPPPLDGLSLLTTAQFYKHYVTSLPQMCVFDDTYSLLLHSRTFPVLDESSLLTPDSTSGHSGAGGYESESDDGFEYDDFDYDDALYGYLDDFEF